MTIRSFLHSAVHDVEHAASGVGHFVELTGESALHAAIQDPIDALEQLANHAIVKPLTGHELPRLELIADLPPAKFGTADWFAETLGMGIGRTADFLALGAGLDALGVTGAAGSFVGSQFANPLEARLAMTATRSALTAGIYGMGFIPAHGEKNFWRQRAVTGLGWAVGGAVGGVIGDYTGSLLSPPTLDDTAVSPLQSIGARGLSAAFRGSTGNVAKTATYVLAGQEAASAKTASERLIRGLTKSTISEAVGN